MNDQYQTAPGDLAALARLWADSPEPSLDRAAELLSADIRAEAAVTAGAAAPAARRPEPPDLRQHVRRRRWIVAGSAAAAAALVAVTLVAPRLLGHPGTGPGHPSGTALPGEPRVSVGTARTEAELVAFAVRSAALSPSPEKVGPHDWFYARTEQASSSGGQGGFLFGRPDQRVVYDQWTRADFRKIASYQHGKLVIESMGPDSPGLGMTLGGWPSVSWRYLNSLPTDPRQLERVIAANNRQRGQSAEQRDYAVFSAISHLLTNQLTPVLPARLYAGLYGVLRILPGVGFDRTTDLAGRHGMGFFLRSNGAGTQQADGWLKEEIVVSPSTYRYMGSLSVAVLAHTFTGLDGSRHVAPGHVLGWMALLDSGIVTRPGQLPG